MGENINVPYKINTTISILDFLLPCWGLGSDGEEN